MDKETSLYYTLIGVMHFVDKWLEGDELKGDEVNRAATMRDKTLRIVEQLEAEKDALIKAQELRTPMEVILHIAQEDVKIGRAVFAKGVTVRKCPRCGEWVMPYWKCCALCGQALKFPAKPTAEHECESVAAAQAGEGGQNDA